MATLRQVDKSMMEESIIYVMEYWKTIMGHKRAKMDMARAKVIRERMRDGYSVEDLMLAIDGCAASAFHMGENDRGQIYDSVCLIFRDADHVDRFVRAGETAHKLIQQRKDRVEKEEAVKVPPTEEQIEKVREMLKSVRLRRVA